MKYRKKPIIVEAEQWFPDKKFEATYELVEEHKDGKISGR